jgi:hypothetical protein
MCSIVTIIASDNYLWWQLLALLHHIHLGQEVDIGSLHLIFKPIALNYQTCTAQAVAPMMTKTDTGSLLLSKVTDDLVLTKLVLITVSYAALWSR